MEIRLRKKDSLRITNGDGLDDVFIDTSFIGSSTGEHYNEGISVSVYGMHQIFIVKKDGDIKLFSFGKSYKVVKEDFKWWQDGEIIFTNSELYCFIKQKS